MIPNFPKAGRPLTDIGLPADLDHVDAAFQWGYNKMVYLVSGFNYWRFNVHENKVEADYPRDMSMWGGVPIPVGAAFQFWDGQHLSVLNTVNHLLGTGMYNENRVEFKL